MENEKITKFVTGTFHFGKDHSGKERPLLLISNGKNYCNGRSHIYVAATSQYKANNIPVITSYREVTYIQPQGLISHPKSDVQTAVSGIIQQDLVDLIRAVILVECFDQPIRFIDLINFCVYIQKYNKAVMDNKLKPLENSTQEDIYFFNIEDIINFKYLKIQDTNTWCEYRTFTNYFDNINIKYKLGNNISAAQKKAIKMLKKIAKKIEKDSLDIFDLTIKEEKEEDKDTIVKETKEEKIKKEEHKEEPKKEEIKEEPKSTNVKSNPDPVPVRNKTPEDEMKEIRDRAAAIFSKIAAQDCVPVSKKNDVLMILSMWLEDVSLNISALASMINLNSQCFINAVRNVIELSELNNMKKKLIEDGLNINPDAKSVTYERILKPEGFRDTVITLANSLIKVAETRIKMHDTDTLSDILCAIIEWVTGKATFKEASDMLTTFNYNRFYGLLKSSKYTMKQATNIIQDYLDNIETLDPYVQQEIQRMVSRYSNK